MSMAEIEAELAGLKTLKELKDRAAEAGLDPSNVAEAIDEAEDDPRLAVRELILRAALSKAEAGR
eukprot:COSAG01_NODE_21698_length_889_cov_1.863291_1_plen_64_part_01